MKIEIVRRRDWSTDKATIGEWLIDGVHQCFNLEDTIRDHKVAGVTAIPAGTYELVWTWSPRFQRDTLRLLNVPHYSGILVHAGNKPEDTEGCQLPGMKRGDGVVLESKRAVAVLEAQICPVLERYKVTGQKLFVTLRNA